MDYSSFLAFIHVNGQCSSGGIPIDQGSDRPIIGKGPIDRGSDRPIIEKGPIDRGSDRPIIEKGPIDRGSEGIDRLLERVL